MDATDRGISLKTFGMWDCNPVKTPLDLDAGLSEWTTLIVYKWLLNQFNSKQASKMGDGGVCGTPCADFSRPAEELEYTCLLTSTFAEASHDTYGASRHGRLRQLTLSVFCGKMYRWGAAYVECHMDPNISKATTGKERVVAACAESQSTSRGPNRTRFLAVQVTIRAKMQ
jgi:hypothetical protein